MEGKWSWLSWISWSLLLLIWSTEVDANLPTFDEDSRMRILLLPFSVLPGATIYRLRASDPDFGHPLEFNFISPMHPRLIKLETIPCGKQHAVCEANVILNEPVEANRIYQLSLSVRDTSGGVTSVTSTIKVTNASVSLNSAFQHLNQFIALPENTSVGTTVDYLIANKNPSNNRGIRMELKRSRYFHLSDKLAVANRTNCSIILDQALNFETQTVHILHVLALNAYVNPAFDTRNLVEALIYIIVVDVQDTPPIFSIAPAVTTISNTLDIGTVVLKVKAEDGDKGNPRPIGYAIMADSSPFAPFFSMDPNSGELAVRKNLAELNQMLPSKAPFVLTVIAEEIGRSFEENDAVTPIDVALMIVDETNDPPRFNQQHYVAHLTENPSVGTALHFGEGQVPQVLDQDQGQDGIFSLSLLGDNSTFEISPSVAENVAVFVIRVKNPLLINFEETRELHFKIVAKEVQQGNNQQSSADVTVYVIDDNDHPPVFEQDNYTVEIPEHSPAGTVVIQVKASDGDSGRYGSIRYTNVYGEHAKALLLDPVSGLVTVSSANLLDRETSPEISVTIEARDNEGSGLSTSVPLLIHLLDINDNVPRFINTPYEVTMSPDLSRFTSKVFVQAVDDDALALNGAVRYEIVRGNYESKFQIDEMTGEMTVVAPLTPTNIPTTITIDVRAYDLGVPHLHSESVVYVHTQVVTSRNIEFIVPKKIEAQDPQTKNIEALLALITGAPTTINNIERYNEQRFISDPTSQTQSTQSPKSRVAATVRFPARSVPIDLERIRNALADTELDWSTVKTLDEDYKYKNRVLTWLVVILCLLFIGMVLILAICCCCPGCYCYANRKSSRFGRANIHPVLIRENKSLSQTTSPGRKEAWSADGKRRHPAARHSVSLRNSRMAVPNRPRHNSRATKNAEERISLDPACDPSFNAGRNYADEHSETDFIEIQPEDSASHQGDNTYIYQRMGNADVMRMETSQPEMHPSKQYSYDALDKMVRRSCSEPRLNDSEREPPLAARNGSKSMVNFPSQNYPVSDLIRRQAELGRNWQQFNHKYVQSPILEETDSALEREMHTGSARLGSLGSGYYIHQTPGLLDYDRYHGVMRNTKHPQPNGAADTEKTGSWQQPNASTWKPRRSLVLERELPFFDNRSSFLRHRSLLSRNSKNNQSKDSYSKSKGDSNKSVKGGSSEAADDTESSGNEHPHGTARPGGVHPVQAASKRLTMDDDLDSGIALNATLREASRRNKYLEKKSIFTIAYDDMATTKIPSTSDHQPS